MDERDRILAALGTYYVASGVTPFASRRAFEAVTGPKADWWLVQTVGALVTTVGATLVGAAARGRVTPEIAALAAGCAASLAAVEVVHVARRRISPVYLADAVAEAAALAALVRARPRRDARVRPA
jgi:hypothetical protein